MFKASQAACEAELERRALSSALPVWRVSDPIFPLPLQKADPSDLRALTRQRREWHDPRITAGRRAVIKSSLHRSPSWLKPVRQAPRSYIYASSALSVNALICRDGACEPMTGVAVMVSLSLPGYRRAGGRSGPWPRLGLCQRRQLVFPLYPSLQASAAAGPVAPPGTQRSSRHPDRPGCAWPRRPAAAARPQSPTPARQALPRAPIAPFRSARNRGRP